jgi:hypothetical protein
MGLFDQDILNSSKVSAEDKAKYKAAMDEADAKEEARYKSGPDREEMARKRKLDAMRKKRDKEEQPSHRWKPKPSESEKGSEGSSKPPKSSMDDLLKLMPIDTLEERILKTYGPNAPKRTGAGGEELPPGLKHGGMVKGGAKQANRTDAYKRKEMEYSEKMYEESKRPKMDYKRAGQEAREGGMSFMGGGMVNATVRPMGMMGGGNVGYTHGGKVDGCSSIQMSGRRPGKTY